MALSTHAYDVLIRESHLDSFGHVNNAAYMVLFEEARWEWITQNGYSLGFIQESRQGPVVLEATVKFKKELTLREKIRITSEMTDYRGKIGHCAQKMIKEDGTLACEALFVVGLFDLNQRKLIDPTPAWRKAIGLASPIV
ncbi:MAG TPA: acyl-CoA thioesterase [bacterium]|nr:acyl-CoA thioesterase [bacterium]